MEELTLTELQRRAHETATAKGWWDNDRPVLEQLMLMVMELSEAAEEWRDGRPVSEVWYSDHGKPEGFPIELADVLIRIADTAERYEIDLTAAVLLKMDYNRKREYRHGGKLA